MAPRHRQLHPKRPKLAAFLDQAETDVIAYVTFPTQHRTKLHSTNPIERLNGETKRRTEVVGIFSNEDAIVHLVGAILFEQNDEWAVQSRPIIIRVAGRALCLQHAHDDSAFV